MSELKPCPFCGGEAKRTDIEEEGENFGGSYISCKRCLASSNLEFGRKENFVRNWNRRASGWQPIETAPRDGTPFIGAFFNIRWADSHRKNDIVRCWWQPEFEAFISSCREIVMAEGYTINGKSREMHSPVIEPVTHWMPLPPTPQGEGE